MTKPKTNYDYIEDACHEIIGRIENIILEVNDNLLKREWKQLIVYAEIILRHTHKLEGLILSEDTKVIDPETGTIRNITKDEMLKIRMGYLGKEYINEQLQGIFGA